MKSSLFPLKRIIFLSFILFTLFAGKEGCKCENDSNLLPSHSGGSSGSSPENFSDGQSNTFGSFNNGQQKNSQKKISPDNSSFPYTHPISNNNISTISQELPIRQQPSQSKKLKDEDLERILFKIPYDQDYEENQNYKKVEKKVKEILCNPGIQVNFKEDFKIDKQDRYEILTKIILNDMIKAINDDEEIDQSSEKIDRFFDNYKTLFKKLTELFKNASVMLMIGKRYTEAAEAKAKVNQLPPEEARLLKENLVSDAMSMIYGLKGQDQFPDTSTTKHQEAVETYNIFKNALICKIQGLLSSSSKMISINSE